VTSSTQFTRPQTTGLSHLGAMLEFYHKLQPQLKPVAEFKDAPQLI